MPEQIQGLIDKIKAEGIQTAEEQAEKIEHDAKAKAGAIVVAAEESAEDIKKEAQEEAERTQAATRKALEQASRDMLLVLRQKIEAMLQTIVAQEVSTALSADQIAGILKETIQATVKDSDEVEVTLSEEDLKKLEEGALAKLQKEVKNDIQFRSSDDLSGGFTISYDAGKSSYDFSDQSLAQYLGSFLNTHVASILKDSVK